MNAGNLLICLIEDLTFQFLSNGTNPRLNCTLREYGFSKHGQAVIKLAFDPDHRINQVATKAQARSLKSELHCHPYCHECFTGICQKCQKCQGKNESSECKQCYLGEKPCLSSKKDKCEVCWGLKAANKKTVKKTK